MLTNLWIFIFINYHGARNHQFLLLWFKFKVCLPKWWESSVLSQEPLFSHIFFSNNNFNCKKTNWIIRIIFKAKKYWLLNLYKINSFFPWEQACHFSVILSNQVTFGNTMKIVSYLPLSFFKKIHVICFSFQGHHEGLW